MLLRPSNYKFQQLIMNMAVLCFHNNSIVITDFVIIKNIIMDVLFCQCNLTPPFSWEMSDIHFVLLCNNGVVFFF